jgi:hypothetical protein
LPTSLVVEDLTPDFISFWNDAADCDLASQRKLWQLNYEDRHRDFFDLYYREWAKRDQLDDALVSFSRWLGSLDEAVMRLRRIVSATPIATARRLEQQPERLSSHLFVGIFASNAWVTQFRGEQTAFFALEQLPDQPCDEILVAHETAHQLHEYARSGRWDDYGVADRLFEEGLATVASEEVVPGRSASEYLWLESGFDEWVDACISSWASTREELLKSLDLSGRDHQRRFFFGAGDNLLPSRVGYWAGRMIIRKMQETHDLVELVTWSPQRAAQATREALHDL